MIDSMNQSNNPITGRKANSSTPILKNYNSNPNGSHENSHNPLSNPMPFNMQNPYLLKEYQRNNIQAPSSAQQRNYLAQVATNNLIGYK